MMVNTLPETDFPALEPSSVFWAWVFAPEFADPCPAFLAPEVAAPAFLPSPVFWAWLDSFAMWWQPFSSKHKRFCIFFVT